MGGVSVGRCGLVSVGEAGVGVRAGAAGAVPCTRYGMVWYGIVSEHARAPTHTHTHTLHHCHGDYDARVPDSHSDCMSD